MLIDASVENSNGYPRSFCHCDQIWQKSLHRLLVADEVVVDEVEMAAISHLVESVDLGQHLLHGLDPRRAPVELDDVAEFAGERAAAGKLHAEIGVILPLQQVEARDRRAGDVGGEFLGLEHPLAHPAIPRLDERADDALGFAEHPEIGAGIGLARGCRIGPADRHRFVMLVRQCDDVQRIGLLRQHPAGHHQVGPIEIGVPQFLGVAVDEAALPGRRQQRGDRDQAERRRRKARPEDLAGRGEVPERLAAEPRRDQEDVARGWHGGVSNSGERTSRAAEKKCAPQPGIVSPIRVCAARSSVSRWRQASIRRSYCASPIARPGAIGRMRRTSSSKSQMNSRPVPSRV